MNTCVNCSGVSHVPYVSIYHIETQMKIIRIVNVGEDCPVFDGLFDFCQIYTSGSVGTFTRLVTGRGKTDVGWFSYRRSEAVEFANFGYCYQLGRRAAPCEKGMEIRV